MLTFALINSASRLSFANDGRTVAKSFALGWPAPALTGVFATPVMESPVAVMFTTLFAFTCAMKTS
jgi:hypothetical protein